MDEESVPLLSGSDGSLDSYRATVRQLIESQLVQGPGLYSNSQLLDYLNKNLDFVVTIIKTALEMQLFPDEPNRPKLDEEASNKPKCAQPSKSKPKRDNKIMFIQSDDSDDDEASNYPRTSKLQSTPKKPTFNFNIGSKCPPGQKGKDSKKNKNKTVTYEEVFDLTAKVNLRSNASKSGSIIKNLKNLEIKLTPKRREDESSDDDDSDDSSSSSSSSSSDTNPEDRMQFRYDAGDERESDKDDENTNHYLAPTRNPKDQESIVPQNQAFNTPKVLPLRNLQEYAIEANNQKVQIAKHRNKDTDIVPNSNPLTPLLGRHDMDLSETCPDFDLAASYLFEHVSTIREENSYPDEKYDIIKDTVKWAYLELNEQSCDLLNHKRHERPKLSVALMRDYARFGRMNIINDFVRDTLTNHQSNLSLFKTTTIDPIFIDDVEGENFRSPSFAVALMILNKFGRPTVHLIESVNNHFYLADILGSSGFDGLQQEEIFACWGEYYTNDEVENALADYTYYIGKDNQTDFTFGRSKQIDYEFKTYENLKYNRIHTYKVIRFNPIKDHTEIPVLVEDLKKYGFAVDGELEYGMREINRDFPLYHMMASGECEQLLDRNFWSLVYRDNEFAPNFMLYAFPSNQFGKVACAFNYDNKLDLDMLINSAIMQITKDEFWNNEIENMKKYKLYGHSKVQRIDLGSMLKSYRDNIRGVVVYDKDFEERGIQSKYACLSFDIYGCQSIIIEGDRPREHTMHVRRQSADLSGEPIALPGARFETNQLLTLCSIDKQIDAEYESTAF